MRLIQPSLPTFSFTEQWGRTLEFVLARAFGDIANQVNGFTDGRIGNATYTVTAAPTTGDHLQGDIARNSTPTEEGSASSKYVVIGWICTASGSPGTWLPMRVLTGN